MPLNIDEVKTWHSKINMAEKRKNKLYVEWAEHYHRLYAGEDMPLGNAITARKLINVNMARPNIDIQKPQVFLDNPKVFVTNRGKFVDTGKKDPLTKVPIVLDAYKMANTLQDTLNPLISEINLRDEVKKCRDDMLIGSMCILFVGYNSEFGVDDEENEFVKDEDIYIQHLSPEMFGVDPELEEFDLSKAKFCYRIVVQDLNDVKDNPHYNNTKDLKPSETAYGKPITENGKTKKLIEFADKEFLESEEAKRVILYEIWKKPTQSEKRKGKKGKIIVLAKGHKKVLREDDWPLQLDGYPFEIETFNRMNDRFYPPFDLQFYEQQLDEKNKLRTYQLEQAKVAGNFKIIGDNKILTDDVKTQLQEGDNTIVGLDLEGKTIEQVLKVVTPGSVSGEYYMVDQKVDRDMELISLSPDAKKGVKSGREQTATEARMEYMGGTTQPMERLKIMSDFYIRIIRKIIQLIKQFYDKKKIVQITGREDVEWTDFGFSSTSIKNEFDVQIDVASMIAKNEALEQRRALDIADRVLRIIESPAAIAKLVQEGSSLNLSEALKEVAKKLDIKNDKILETLTDKNRDEMMQYIQLLLMKGKSSQGNMQQGIPTEASEQARANNVAPGPMGMMGETI